MELGTFERQLRLMVMLAQNRLYTNDEICLRLGISRRTLYRYIELFRDTGFAVRHEGGCWRIDRSSPFFRDITDRVTLNDEEALTLRHILDGVSPSHVQARLLKAKLSRIYDFGLVTDEAESDDRLAGNLNMIYEAMKEHCMAILCNYSSANSRTVSNRIVEPFQLLQGGGEVRCYEPASNCCKTFKMNRIEKVRIVSDVKWSCEHRHKVLTTDAFGFSGESTQTVVLRMGSLALNLLREERPQAMKYVEGDRLTIPVCSFLGLGRFVMGLPEEVEVLQNDAFRDFLREKMCILQKKL